MSGQPDPVQDAADQIRRNIDDQLNAGADRQRERDRQSKRK